MQETTRATVTVARRSTTPITADTLHAAGFYGCIVNGVPCARARSLGSDGLLLCARAPEPITVQHSLGCTKQKGLKPWPFQEVAAA